MKLIKRTLVAALLSASALASASPVYVGSWLLHSGPSFREGVPTYTGQEAAAVLFGGVAGDYVISSVGSAVADIDFMAWYDQYGNLPGLFAQDYRSDGGEPGVYDADGDSSAMVLDHPMDGQNTYMNYAFRLNHNDSDIQVPEPLSVGLMGAGLLGMALVRRRRRRFL